MKKLAIVFCLIASSILLFAGCGYTGSVIPVSISFVREEFYVDMNIPCTLDYKILPSSASVVSPTFEPVYNYEEITYFDFNANTGTITVHDSRFTEIKVNLRCGDLTPDECRVILKKYPTSISFDEATYSLSAGTMTELVCNGLFGIEERAINDSYYNVSLVSSDPTVVSVEDANRFLIKSTGKPGSSTITAKLVDVNGDPVLISNGGYLVEIQAQTTVNVIGNVESALVIIDNNFIRNLDSTIHISASELAMLEIETCFMDKNDFLIENVETIIMSLNDSVITIVKENGKTYLKVMGAGTAEIVISSNGYDASGEFVVFHITCQTTII